MKRILIFSIALLICSQATAQDLADIQNKDMLEVATQVLVLTDGEQIVIRGDYTVRGEHTYFYYDNGAFPLYAVLESELIDFDATDKANEELHRERIRRDNYYLLIEEVQRKALEEEQTGPLIVDSADTSVAVDPEFEDDIRTDSFYIQVARQFPPYDEEQVEYQTEEWWRSEARRLYAALHNSSRRMEQLEQDYNVLAQRIRRADSAAQQEELRKQLQQFRDAQETEKNLRRLIGNRLVELSEYASELEIPLQWIIPDEKPEAITES